LHRILDKAAGNGIFVCIDMEESRYVRQTLEIFSRASRIYGRAAAGITFQSYLIDFRDELQRLIERNSRIRLVRGGYWELPTAVFSKRSEITEAFRTDVDKVMIPGQHPAIATHDSEVLALTTQLARDRGLGRDEFEFQMLLGVGRDLQKELVQQGYPVRIYVPYGKRWQPYLLGCLRRLAGSSIGWNRTRSDDALLIPCSKNSDEPQHHEF
jgi:proline dehydrogenase